MLNLYAGSIVNFWKVIPSILHMISTESAVLLFSCLRICSEACLNISVTYEQVISFQPTLNEICCCSGSVHEQLSYLNNMNDHKIVILNSISGSSTAFSVMQENPDMQFHASYVNC